MIKKLNTLKEDLDTLKTKQLAPAAHQQCTLHKHHKISLNCFNTNSI